MRAADSGRAAVCDKHPYLKANNGSAGQSAAAVNK